MPTIIKNVQALLVRVLLWRMVFFVGGVVSSATLAALSGMDWATASTQSRLMVVIGVCGTVAGTVGAFLDQSAQRLVRGELPFIDAPIDPAPGTVKKTVTAQVETTTTPSAPTAPTP